MSKTLIQAKVKDGSIKIPLQIQEAMKIKEDSDVVIEYDGDGVVFKIPDSENLEGKWEQLCKEAQTLNPNITEEEIADLVQEYRTNRTDAELKKLMVHD